LKQDRFTATTMETVSWAVEHRKPLVITGLVAAVAAAIILGGWYYLQSREQMASNELGHALRIYEAQIAPAGTPAQPGIITFTSAKDRARAAQTELRAVAAKYKHTHSGELARYFAALTDADLGNNSAAEQELKQVAGAHNQDLAALAKMALASIYRNANRDADAIALYKQLIEHPTTSVSKPRAQLELADLYSAKQPSEAKRLYEQIAKENPTSPAAQMANSHMADLK
jgi:predicted negative regulator of RcsB-dependent stress response